MNSFARVAPAVKSPAVRLIFDSAEMGWERPRPFASGLPARRPKFQPSEADRAWWAAESARLAECRELDAMHAESVAIARLERGCCL